MHMHADGWSRRGTQEGVYAPYAPAKGHTGFADAPVSSLTEENLRPPSALLNSKCTETGFCWLFKSVDTYAQRCLADTNVL